MSNSVSITQPCEAVLFDCDGTLLDTMEVWHEMECSLARRAGVEMTPALAEKLNANTLAETVRFFFGQGVGITEESLRREVDDYLLAAYGTNCVLKPGAQVLVERLVEAGATLAVVSSNTNALVERGLEACGLLKYFSLVVSAEDEGATKQNPQLYRDVCFRLGVDMDRAWAVDDSIYALQAMRKAGLHTLGVYDSDEAGSMLELVFAADYAVESLEFVSVQEPLLNPERVKESAW